MPEVAGLCRIWAGCGGNRQRTQTSRTHSQADSGDNLTDTGLYKHAAWNRLADVWYNAGDMAGARTRAQVVGVADLRIARPEINTMFAD